MAWGPPVEENAEPVQAPSAGWGPPAAEQATKAETKGWGEPEDDTERMPGTFEALGQGFKAGLSDIGQSKQAIAGEKPEVVSETSEAAKPYEWSDLTSPIARGLPKVAYSLAKSAPTLGAGIAGGVAGSPAGPVGAIAGGALGAAGGAALQTIGPSFAAELKKSPNDPDGAWGRALQQAEISGLFSGAGWALFPAKFFQGPLKNLAFQAFGIQPAVSMGEKATQNIAADKPATEGLGQAYVQGAVGTAVPLAGQHMIQGIAGAGKAAAVVQPHQFIGPQQPSVLNKIPGSGYVKAAIEGYKKSFQPELMGDLALQTQGPMREMISAVAQGRDAVRNTYDAFHNQLERLSPQEQIDFMKAAAGEAARNPLHSVRSTVPNELKPAYDAFRTDLDTTGVMDQNAGSKMGWVNDYMPRLYKAPEQVKTFVLDQINKMGAPAFQKKRSFDLMQDALDAGFELKHPNPADAVESRLTAGVSFRARMKLMSDMESIGTAKKMPDETQALNYQKAGWQIVKDPVGEMHALHPDVQPMWKSVMESKGLWGLDHPIGDAFRGWMNFKNAYVPIKLGLSLFHPLHVAGIHFADSMTRGYNQLRAGNVGDAFKSAAQSLTGLGYFPQAMKAREAWLTPEWRQTPEQQGIVKLMKEGGFSPQLSEQLRMKGHRAYQDALSHGSWTAYPKGMVEGMRKIQGVIFEKWIPSLKTAAYLNEAKALFERRPDLFNDAGTRRAALGEIAKSVDNRFGEMFYSNLFWNKTLKDAGIGSFLSLGWNLGFLREFGGGMLEPLMRPLIEQTPTRAAMTAAKSKTAFSLFYMASAMVMGGLMTKIISGENPQDIMDYILPRMGGNNPDGSPRRLSTMFYTREIPMAAKHIQEKDSVLGGLKEMLWNKSMFEPFHEMYNNRDYYGYNIMDENSPWYKKAYQMGSFVLSDQFSPITISGAKRALQASGKWDDKDSLLTKGQKLLSNQESGLAFLGFGPAPAYASKSAAQNRLAHLFQQYVSPSERPQADKKTMEDRRDARAQYMLATQSKDPERITAAAKHLADLGVKSAQIRKIQPGTSDLYLYQRLPQTIQVDFLKDLSAEDFKRYYPKSNKATKADPEVIKLWQRYYRNP